MVNKNYILSLLFSILLCGCSDSSNGSEQTPDGDSPEPQIEQEARCGDGILQNGEVCDGDIGVMQDCDAWDNSIRWLSGKPACAADCKSIVVGTCVEATDEPQTSE